MKLCFICDLHLPRFREVLQFDALRWALADAARKKADAIIVAGDITCDGDLTVYSDFVEKIGMVSVPVLYIPGNSDLRDKTTVDIIKGLASPCVNQIGDVTVYALNDCDKTVKKEDLILLEGADKNSIVFMHHPIPTHDEKTRERLTAFADAHRETMIFFGHKHRSLLSENTVSLQALDPDKAIGEPPCITYYDTDTHEMEKAYYFAPLPTDLYESIGISCYRPRTDIAFATAHRLKSLELRGNILKESPSELKELLQKWREAGGEDLSVHLSDVGFENGKVSVSADHSSLISLAKELGANRLTQHVPRVSVGTVKAYPDALERITEYIANALESVGGAFVLGIENMHMTASEDASINRRYGYTPEECLHFMKLLASRCSIKVGINLDIGHARNNMPFSQTYQVGTWLSLLGKYIVGYHLHQVTKGAKDLENHMPITELHGGIINFTSFFKNWTQGKINRAPVILEMRPEHAYEISIKALREHIHAVCDLHSHTYYSWCGKDRPELMVETAIESGISTLGITDHAHGIGDRMDEYLREIRDVAEKYKNRIRVLCGIEIATIPQRFDEKITDKIKRFDYCLIEHITDPASGVGKDLIAFCEKAEIPCGIAHTDLFEYCAMYGYDPEVYFKELAQRGIFWEMNVNYDSIHHYRKHSYVHDFMNDEEKIKTVQRTGLKVSLGFDSHRCEEYYAPALYDAHAFLDQKGILFVI